MSANRLKLNADKTELVWAGSRHSPAMLGSAGPSLQLRTKTVVASDQVRVLGVTMSSDLSLDKHVNCQRMCDVLLLASSAQKGPTFTRCGVRGYAGPRFCDITRRLLQRHSRWGIQIYHNKLQRVMNAAARVVSDSRKYDRGLTSLLHECTTNCTGLTFTYTVRRLPSAACAATPPFDVRSSSLFCGRPGGLELVTRLPSRSTRSVDSFRGDLKTILFSFY